MKKKNLTARYGTYMHDLPGLLEKYQQIRENCGMFEIVPSPIDWGMKALCVQSKLMGDYATSYGDLRMANGTFKLCQYNFVFIIWIIVDCLLRSCTIGFTCRFSETAVAIVEGAKIFLPQDRNVTNKVKAGAFFVTSAHLLTLK